MDADSPYAPPKSQVIANNDHGWDGKYFRLRSPGAMPAWCLRCGDDAAAVEKTVKLRWTNPFTYLWIFVSPIVLMIAYLIVVKRVPVTYRHCTDCATRTARWTMAMRAAFALFVLAFIGCFLLEAGDLPRLVLAWTCFAALVAGLVAAAVRAPAMAILKHSDGVFYVGRLKKAFRARFGG